MRRIAASSAAWTTPPGSPAGRASSPFARSKRRSSARTIRGITGSSTNAAARCESANESARCGAKLGRSTRRPHVISAAEPASRRSASDVQSPSVSATNRVLPAPSRSSTLARSRERRPARVVMSAATRLRARCPTRRRGTSEGPSGRSSGRSPGRARSREPGPGASRPETTPSKAQRATPMRRRRASGRRSAAAPGSKRTDRSPVARGANRTSRARLRAPRGRAPRRDGRRRH